MPRVKKEKIINTCEDCGSEQCKKFRIESKYLCDECMKKDDHTYITKTRVKSDFFLNDGDLETVNYQVVKNPHYSSRSMYLYNLQDIKNKFVEKYGDDEDIDSKMAKLFLKKKQKGKRIIESKAKCIENREELLQAKMAEKGLEIRADSKLCHGFINGTIKMDVDDVVKRMCQVKYLFEYCDMDKCFEIAKREQREEYNAGYFPDEPLFEHAERIALKKCGGYPVEFPWLQ